VRIKNTKNIIVDVSLTAFFRSAQHPLGLFIHKGHNKIIKPPTIKNKTSLNIIWTTPNPNTIRPIKKVR